MTQITVIEPPSRWPAPGLREAWRYRSVCFGLARRSVMVHYRQTVLGVLWSLLQPLLMVVLFNVIFGLVGRSETDGLPFTVFHATGVFAFYIASRQINEGSTSVVANGPLLTRVYFPRVFLPLSVAIAHVIDTVNLIVALILLGIFYGVQFGPPFLLMPVFILVCYAFAVGASLWLSAINAKYRDVSVMLPFLLQVLFFASPVIYTVAAIPKAWLPVYYLNPVAFVIQGFRWSFGGATPPPPVAWAVSCPVAIIVLISGYLFFRSREATFADVV